MAVPKKGPIGWLFITIAVALIAMLVVHFLYSFNAPAPCLEAKWCAGDVLGYMGSIIGACATIFVLLATIDYEREADEERAKHSMRPVIAISNPEKPLSGWNLVGLTISEDDFDPIGEEAAYRKAREEYIRADCYVVASKDGSVSYKATLSTEDYDLAVWAEAQVIHKESKPTFYGNAFRAWFVKFVLTSMGNGPAINVHARLVEQDFVSATGGEKMPCSPAVQLMVGGEWTLGLLVPAERSIPEETKQYRLVLTYEDADGRRYEQSHALTMTRLGNKGQVDGFLSIDQREIGGTSSQRKPKA